MILAFKKFRPKIHPSAFVAPNASVIGKVEIGRHVSVWFGAVLRGDIEKIVIGDGSNVQDNAVLHTETDIPCALGAGVVVGHQATVHGCRVRDGTARKSARGPSWRPARSCWSTRKSPLAHSRWACPRRWSASFRTPRSPGSARTPCATRSSLNFIGTWKFSRTAESLRSIFPRFSVKP